MSVMSSHSCTPWPIPGWPIPGWMTAGIDAEEVRSETEFEVGERVVVPFIEAEGVYVRRESTVWLVLVDGSNGPTRWRRIDHRPLLDRLAEL